MSKLKSNKKTNPYVRRIVVTHKINSEEYREYVKKAHQWTGGNISEWVRFAALNFKPKKEDSDK